MKYSLLLLLVLSNTTLPAFSQEVSKTDPTYFRVDYGDLSDLLIWKGEKFQNIAFTYDTMGAPSLKGLTLHVNPRLCKNLPKKHFTPFVLDTTQAHRSGYYYYSPHPDWFYSLKRVNARNITQPTVVGRLKKDIRIDQATVKDLFRLLLMFGVVDTYFHLYAELVITNTKEEDTMIEIAYNCVFHYCTTKCFDPAYSFKMQFNKTSKEIILLN